MKSFFYLLPLCLVFLFACKDDADDKHPDGLAVGESVADSVQAVLKWNDMGVVVQAGETFKITSSGDWLDWTIVTDADGFFSTTLEPFNHLKRVPDAQWFELVASVDSVNFYIIGSDTSVTFNETGWLKMFANDAEDFYDNNSGSIYTNIKRTE